MQVPASEVRSVVGRHMLADGFEQVLDVRASRGAWLVDARDGSRYLDLFTFFASNPLGMNHPGLVEDRAFLAELAMAAVNKPSNSDIYTTQMAAFVDTFARVLGDPALPHLFFVEGGALAVENALKTAFDWKSRHNELHGRSGELGAKVLHLRQAFHGRTGYTMSLTNTDANKVARFPKFNWPRIDSPAMRFPLDDHLAAVERAEAQALEQARAAFAAHPHDIAAFIAEPIQGEGGDNHLRGEFLQAMKSLCHEHDALFILDEVQTGAGMTGSVWAYQQLGVTPDIVAFGKKTQVCGIMAGGRVDEIAENVFAVSSRINSTWGGNLTDMVRSTKILEVIESENLVDNAREAGAHLLAGLQALAAARPEQVSNPRGRGLMCAVDLPDAQIRDAVASRLLTDEQVIMLGCGERSLRFRPPLTISRDELDAGLQALDRVLEKTA